MSGKYNNKCNSDNQQTANSNEECEVVNYDMILLDRCEGRAIGTIEDYKITVFVNGQKYVFDSKNGSICSCKSPTTLKKITYEVM